MPEAKKTKNQINSNRGFKKWITNDLDKLKI